MNVELPHVYDILVVISECIYQYLFNQCPIDRHVGSF